MLIDGMPGNMISIRDRGLLYGDGVFRTLRAVGGVALHWPLHYRKLSQDCAGIGIACPDFGLLDAELQTLLRSHPDSVYKVIVTRGLSVRGYAPSAHAAPTHLWDVSPAPDYPEHAASLGLCSLRLGLQPRLAGIKHLNRLENVLAAAECTGYDEGLLQDSDGRVIEGVRSNLFLFLGNALVTPDLARCGVAGVQRERVIAHAQGLGFSVEVRDVALDELCRADELFLANSVFGLWPVASFADRHWNNFERTRTLTAALQTDPHA